MSTVVEIDPRVVAMRERQARERSGLMERFLDETPWFMGDVGVDFDNWTPEEHQAWRQFTAEIDARQKAERHELAVDMGYYPAR